MAEVTSSQAQTASQMSTQSLKETQENSSQVLDTSLEEPVWGRLLAMRANVNVYHLSEPSYVFGRGAVDHQLAEHNFDTALLPVISKKHFRILREVRNSSAGGEDAVVFLDDLSSNGTFINNQLVGAKKRVVLRNNDAIGLAQPNRVFLFHDVHHNEDAQHPDELTRKYTITKKIGEGTFGEVRLAYKLGTVERCAIKILKKQQLSSRGTTLLMNNVSKIRNEVELLRSIEHPCIVRLWDVVESLDNIYLVMELAEGGELFDRIRTNGRLSEPVARLYCYQLALAISHLHSKGITHRDLKPENILLATEDVRSCIKLTDFGLSKFTDASQMSTFCGTQLYIAPELLEVSSHVSYTNKVDVWSFGVVLFVCLAGSPPFHDNNKLNMRYLIRTACFNFDQPVWDGVSNDAQDLIKHLLVADAVDRYDINAALKHPWFQDSEMRDEAEQLMRRSVDCTTPQEAVEVENGDCFSEPAAVAPPAKPVTEAKPAAAAAAAVKTKPAAAGKKREAPALDSPGTRRRVQDAKTPRLCNKDTIL